MPGERSAGPLSAWESRLKEQARPYLQKGRPDDWDHTLRAIENGKALLKEEKGDPEVVITALVLHDIGWSRVSFDDFVQAPPEKKRETRSLKEHMVQGAVLAREILEPHGKKAGPRNIRARPAAVEEPGKEESPVSPHG